MEYIECNRCKAVFKPEELAIYEKVLTRDEEGDDVIEQYFECPACGISYGITVIDRKQRLLIQRRRQLQDSIRRLVGLKQIERSEKYRKMEREVADELTRRAKELKERYHL